MSSSFEKSVKGGTKIKLAAPKSKYVEHILIATHAGESGVAEIFRALQNRLRDSTWTIVFKGLIIVHLMIREGEPDVTLQYLAHSPRKLAISNFTDVQVQGRSIRCYVQYLLERSKGFRETKIDYVRSGEGRLKRLTIEKGLLRETEQVQLQIGALVKCVDMLTEEPENEITLTAFRLLTMDLLALFHVMNEATISVLEHFFELSKFDAERALGIYRTFTKQTEEVVTFLGVARHFETATRLEVPKIKHAPTGLTNSLEEYLNDTDFDLNRRQYLAQQDARKRGGASKPFGDSKPAPSKFTIGEGFPSPSAAQSVPSKPAAKGPAPDLIDFFDSIEQNQQPMFAPTPQQQQMPQFQQVPQIMQQPQPSGFISPQQQQQQQQQPFTAPQQTGFPTGQSAMQQAPFGTASAGSYGQAPQIQTQYASQQPPPLQTTNLGSGGFNNYQSPITQPFSPQQSSLASIPQNGVPNFQPQSQQAAQPFSPQSPIQQQSTNPFRQSMAQDMTGASASSYSTFSPSTTTTTSLQRQPTNPFAKRISPQGTPAAAPQLQPAPTGTNPFARDQFAGPSSPAIPQQPVSTNQTGSTNPFRQSMFHNAQTGQGWQAGQGTMGGFEQLPTVPVFPRPGQPSQQSPNIPQQGWM
ncbi:ANTH-domain-containing protein [Xylona heveae TC161]|uniref:ANTH-domain-containing protein n=1 Tax=Xylona heveae (strain CBS 132557 / TC161) TaxID=1328760 RepID=A0A165JGM1_XYLHT|nr:ANTH-domain-containing protein [Xylona heveae TC161]KZF26211.1 ANTH-domain-containing protein [Xylona heveae TC161]